MEAGQHPRGVHRHTLWVCGLLGCFADSLWICPRLDAGSLRRTSVTLDYDPDFALDVVQAPARRLGNEGLLDLFMLKRSITVLEETVEEGARPRGTCSGC